jgi:hypothetical protein
MTEFSKVREMLDRLLLLDCHVTSQQFEDATKDASFIRDKFCKFQQRAADKTYSAAMIQKVAIMQEDVNKIDSVLNNARLSAESSKQSEMDRQRAELEARQLCLAMDSLFSAESSARNGCILEEQRSRNQVAQLSTENLAVCRRKMTARIQKQKEEMKVKAQIEEEQRQKLTLESQLRHLKEQEEETRNAREQERFMKRQRMENFLQQRRRIAVEEALSDPSTPCQEFEFQIVDSPSTDSVKLAEEVGTASDEEAEQRLIEEALALSLLPLSPNQNPKPEVQGS